MKSIMEEASSIMKAIEKGWASAGQPKEFTIKVYEEPQKNFLGMTTRPAKIGIFFTELPTPKPATKKAESVRPRQAKADAQPAREPRTIRAKEPVIKPQRTVEEQRALGPVWNDEMIALVKELLNTLFPLMDLGRLNYTIKPEHFHLRIEFATPVYEDKSREKHLFVTLSMLILTMLKRQFKRPLKGYKIVLVGG